MILLGKRAGSVGPGRPSKYPNLNSEEQTPLAAQAQSVGTTSSSSSGGGLVDILNQLDSNKRNEMLSLVGQYKNRVLSLNDFMMRARELLGERLYVQLSRDMNNAAAARNVNIPPSAGSTATTTTSVYTTGMPSMMRNASVPIHSMPQIYGTQPNFPVPPQIPPHIQQHHNPIEIDVTKMDTSSLQDVMQYSGVDLKAEAELLYREHDLNNAAMMMTNGGFVDHRLKFDYFFNPFKFRAIVQHALQRHFFSNTINNGTTPDPTSSGGKMNKPLGITEEAVHLLGIAIQKRLIGILRRLSEISRHRVDYGRGRFKIKIENDPKKQIWLQEKLFIEGVGEDKRKATGTTGATSSSPVNQTLLNPPSINATTGGGNINKINPPAPQTSSSSATQSKSSASTAGTDDTVKTKLANVTALAALGIRQKSWMSSATTMNTGAPTATAGNNSQSSATNDSSSTLNEEKEPAEVYQHPLANFYSLPSSTPLTDSELRAQYYNRTISTMDLITCMESDSHLRRSRLLAVLYDALPRENKENSSD